MNALEVYILISLAFVMSTMIELAVVLLVKRKYEWANGNAHSGNQEKKLKRASHKQKQQVDNRSKALSSVEEEHLVFRTMTSGQNTMGSQGLVTTTERIDFAALILYIASYAIFNCFYWVRH